MDTLREPVPAIIVRMIRITIIIMIGDAHYDDKREMIKVQGVFFTGTPRKAYLIFVTDTRTVSVEEKSVMWRNFKFLYRTDVEKSKISPHLD